MLQTRCIATWRSPDARSSYCFVLW